MDLMGLYCMVIKIKSGRQEGGFMPITKLDPIKKTSQAK